MLVPVPLPTINYSAGGNDVIPLRNLPKTLYGRICHLESLTFDVAATITRTAGPTVVGVNNVVQACDVWDGKMFRFQGGFNEARMFDLLHNGGRPIIADPFNQASSGDVVYFRRVVRLGPPNFVGGADHGGHDFVFPCGALENGEVRVTYGALTDISSDTTAVTCPIYVTANIKLLDYVHIPPAYQFFYQSLGAADNNIAGKALVESIGLCDSITMGAWSAGEVGALTVDAGFGDIVPTVRSQVIDANFKAAYKSGAWASVEGDAASMTVDVNGRQPNRASFTAIAAADKTLQPVIFSAPAAKITKLLRAESVTRLRWSGSQSTAYMLMGRFLEQPGTVSGEIASRALFAIGKRSKGEKIKTHSKQPYNGPLAAYMPIDVSVQ